MMAARSRTASRPAKRRARAEIVNLADVLTGMGAKISGAGTDVITITGVPGLPEPKRPSFPDRIEAAPS
jgi:UDP-N-acetylglucosamine 1-carboxyvinyltransferase